VPELPEIATIHLGLSHQLVGQRIQKMIVRHWQLRYPIANDWVQRLPKAQLTALDRRGKYLLFYLDWAKNIQWPDPVIDPPQGFIWHLGMSGSFRLIRDNEPAGLHDHIDLIFDRITLRYHDPRRFGAVLFAEHFASHPLLVKLGVEPLESSFSATYLLTRLQGKKQPIKQALMDHRIVAGIGNIYANEILFTARMMPLIKAQTLSFCQCQRLVIAIKNILKRAIQAGGTSIRDFVDARGNPGYFQRQLSVYGRAGLPCYRCHQPIHVIKLAGRRTFYCPCCQSS